MPISQSILPLIGWLLGPIAGAVGSAMGTTIGTFLAPYTAGIPALSIWGAMIAGFTAGTMGLGKKRKYWWLGLSLIFVLELFIYLRHAIVQNGVPLNIAIVGSFVDWSGLILFILPTRILFARWIGSPNIGLVAAGIFLGTWTVWSVTHLSQITISYYIFNWPKEVWIALIPIMPLENLVRCLAASAIGTGVISGLRSINLVKPQGAIY